MTHRLPGTIAAALLAACGSGGPPDPAPGAGTTYALSSVAGQALPAPYALNPAAGDRAHAGTLTLGDDGRGAFWLRADAGGRVRETRSAFGYTRQGERVVVTFDCDDTASCVAGPHLVGRLTEGGGLRVDSSTVMRAPLLFVRGDH